MTVVAEGWNIWGCSCVQPPCDDSSLGAVLCVLASACVGLLDDDALEAADPLTPAPSVHALPDAEEVADDATLGGSRRPCTQLIAEMGLKGQALDDAELLCTLDAHVEHTTGFIAYTTPGRMAYECLLDAGHPQVVYALADAREPAVRAFAYESLATGNAWTLSRIEDALSETSRVDTSGGCNIYDLELQEFGVAAALRWPDRDAVEPLLRAWATHATPQRLAPAYAERGGEPWVDLTRARSIFEDTALTIDARASAAIALAAHGESIDPKQLLGWSRGPRDYRYRSIRALDVLGYAQAWSALIEASSYVPTELLILGAHWAPDDAIPFIDDQKALKTMLELPTRLRTPRLAAMVCGFDPDRSTNPKYLRSYGNPLVDTLEDASPRDRCAAFDPAQAPCREEVLRRAGHALNASMAAACGLGPPEPHEWVSYQEPCQRDKGTMSNAERLEEQRERAQLLELERRAHAAAKAAANTPD